MPELTPEQIEAAARDGYCDQCHDGDGQCVFPYYGVAPHTHDAAGNWIGSTRVLPKGDWGDNFEEDLENPYAGTYLRCPHCGNGQQVIAHALKGDHE